jgi:hypothetical protein
MNDIASALESEVKDMENEKHQEKNDRVFVGLLIVTMYHISVGVLMESSALDEQTHINKIVSNFSFLGNSSTPSENHSDYATLHINRLSCYFILLNKLISTFLRFRSILN